jgi:hypothetical protein
VVRDLDTGERAERVLAPQFGAIGSLVVTARGHVLLVFSGTGPVFAAWHLDGPGVGGELVVPGRRMTGGYDPTGQMLLVDDPDRQGSEVVDADTGKSVLRLGVPGDAVWLSSDTVGVTGRRPVLVDVPTGQVRDLGLDGSTEALYPEPGGSYGWAVSRRDGTFRLRRLSLSTGQLTTTITLDRARGVRLVSDGTSLFVTSQDTNERWGTKRYDVVSGTELESGLSGRSRVAILPDHSLVTSTDTGEVREYGEIAFKARAAYPPVDGAASSIQVAAHGSRVLVTASDQTVQLYDVTRRARIGGPIPAPAPTGAIQAWLRPDGQALATNSGEGVVEWDLSPDAMLSATCELAGRNWTPTEWSTYVGATPYQTNCAQFGIPGLGDQHPDE